MMTKEMQMRIAIDQNQCETLQRIFDTSPSLINTPIDTFGSPLPVTYAISHSPPQSNYAPLKLILSHTRFNWREESDKGAFVLKTIALLEGEKKDICRSLLLKHIAERAALGKEEAPENFIQSKRDKADVEYLKEECEYFISQLRQQRLTLGENTSPRSSTDTLPAGEEAKSTLRQRRAVPNNSDTGEQIATECSETTPLIKKNQHTQKITCLVM